MFESTIEALKVESWKARQLCQDLEMVAGKMATIEQQVFVKYEIVEQKPIDEAALKRKFIQTYKNEYLEVFKEEIADANVKSSEYSRKSKFFTKLVDVIRENIDTLLLAIVDGGVGEARNIMEFVAGDFNDFIDGVIIARDVISGLSEKDKQILAYYNKLPSKAKRDWVWRNVIWPDDDAYDKTINIRFSAWGNKAPYWVLLDMGNEDYEGAFPKFTATNFFYQAVQRILIDLNERMAIYKTENRAGQTTESRIRQETKQMIVKISQLIYEAVAAFLRNPDFYAPGSVFQTYKDVENGLMYKIWVTPTKKIGVRKL